MDSISFGGFVITIVLDKALYNTVRSLGMERLNKYPRNDKYLERHYGAFGYSLFL